MTEQEVPNNTRFFAGLGTAVAIALIGGVTVITMSNGSTDSVSQQPSSGASPTTTIAKPEPSTAAQFAANDEACNGYAVKLDPHTDGKVISGGIPAELSPEERIAFIAQHAKQDPSVFQSYYNDSPFVKTLHIKEPITDPATLVQEMKDGACWTEDGIKKLDEWTLMWSMTDAVPVPLPATGANTGVSNGSAFQIAPGPIPAGTATQFTYHDAKGAPVGNTTSRNECGNPVSPAAIPGLPVRPAPANYYTAPPPRPPAPPVRPPVQPPVQPPVRPPVQPPVRPPVQPPVQPPVRYCPPGTTGTYPNCVTPPPPPPPPVYQCPPGTTGHYPVCKDEESNGPAKVVTPQQQPNALPALPQYEEPVHPDVAPPPAVYEAPRQDVVIPVPQEQGGPTAYPSSEPSPRQPESLPPVQAEAPTISAPSSSCIAAPGSSC